MRTIPFSFPAMPCRRHLSWLWLLTAVCASAENAGEAQENIRQSMMQSLDAPLLFVKRHSYTGIHIYDTFYKWPPGGGGIYVLENPAAPRDQWLIRTVIDEHTPGGLGHGVYTHPNLSWDGTRLLFCFKGAPNGDTSIYEIGVDGSNLRRITDPSPTNVLYKGSHGGQHDVAPAYLPDDRIVFLSTRPSGLVPCANSGVNILHVMNADGSDIHTISVNNVNEFDPAVLPDGRILFGRWEYIDKNALTIQSLWTVNPDGTQETAFYANNMVLPEAILDARPVPGSHLIVGTFAKHNAVPRGSIALVDPHKGKNNPEAITNLEHPNNPTFDRGNSCEPWAVSADLFLFSGRPPNASRNAIEMIDRSGNRILLLDDRDICLHSPMLVMPRPRPPVIPASTDRTARSGRFFIQDIYEGLDGVQRGEVKQLRVLEETSRTSGTGMRGSPFNQVSLISAALAWSPKIYHGVVPVEEDGSVHFEAPSGRALYLQALDADGRLVQSMRSFVQAAPGTTRSCVGCHEQKFSAPPVASAVLPAALIREPSRLAPERWGSGYLDYPSMIQPILDRHCADCHGGVKGIGGGIDLSGGWTRYFSISYENMVSRRQTQLTAYWIAGIDCMNSTAFWSSRIFQPRTHGSGAAPLASLIMSGHKGRLPNLCRSESDLLMAWIDSNGLYHGTWDYAPGGPAANGWDQTMAALQQEMNMAGCVQCHSFMEDDWINLRNPEHSRMLRAPMARGDEDLGLALCRDRKMDPSRRRIHLLRGGYGHSVRPIEAFPRYEIIPPDYSGEPHIRFASSQSPHYQSMLRIIQEAQRKVLAAPRIDMPGADAVAVSGTCRMSVPPPLPDQIPELTAVPDRQGKVHLSWTRSAGTIGMEVEWHRGNQADFVPGTDTLLSRSSRSAWTDTDAPIGLVHYAIILVSDEERSLPSRTRVEVPPLPPPAAPLSLRVEPGPHLIWLHWELPDPPGTLPRYHVYRLDPERSEFVRITDQPITGTRYLDSPVAPDLPQTYHLRALGRCGQESEPSAIASAAAIRQKDPVFTVVFNEKPAGLLADGSAWAGAYAGKARGAGSVLDLSEGGFATFPNHMVFDLSQPFSIAFRVRFDRPGEMPVMASSGQWQRAGWFVQYLGGKLRWHVAGIDCDGGTLITGEWMHVACTFDGQTARIYQGGELVGERSGAVNTPAWQGPMLVGQYSANPHPRYQTNGSISGLTLHHRALPPEVVRQMALQPGAIGETVH